MTQKNGIPARACPCCPPEERSDEASPENRGLSMLSFVDLGPHPLVLRHMLGRDSVLSRS